MVGPQFKNIVIDCRMYKASGIGRYLQNLLPSIIEKTEYSISLLGNPNELDDYIRYPTVQVIPFADKIYSISEQWHYRKVIPPCDLFWSPHFNVPLLPIRAAKRLVTIHDAYHLAFKNQLSRKERLYADVVYRAAMSRSDKIITVSNFSKNELTKHTRFKHPEKIDVIHNGINQISVSTPIIIARQTIPYLLYVGNVKPHKNLKSALLGFADYVQRIQLTPAPLKFMIVGKKEGFLNGDTEIAGIINDNIYLKDRVQFTGYVSDEQLAQLYIHAKVFVFPSLYEGFGFPPLESMSYGTPVICSNAACMPEICGNAVLYIDPLNAQSISDAIHRLMSEPDQYDTLVTKGYHQIKQFSWRASISSHINTIEQLLNT